MLCCKTVLGEVNFRPPIAHKQSDRKMKSTLKRELNSNTVCEMVGRETLATRLVGGLKPLFGRCISRHQASISLGLWVDG
jgi:hypothetical protein